MSCKKCGKRTTRSRLCVDCGRDEQRADVDYSERWEDYECPSCGHDTAIAEGRECHYCRSNLYELVGGEHQMVDNEDIEVVF